MYLPSFLYQSYFFFSAYHFTRACSSFFLSHTASSCCPSLKCGFNPSISRQPHCVFPHPRSANFASTSRLIVSTFTLLVPTRARSAYSFTSARALISPKSALPPPSASNTPLSLYGASICSAVTVSSSAAWYIVSATTISRASASVIAPPRLSIRAAVRCTHAGSASLYSTITRPCSSCPCVKRGASPKLPTTSSCSSGVMCVNTPPASPVFAKSSSAASNRAPSSTGSGAVSAPGITDPVNVTLAADISATGFAPSRSAASPAAAPYGASVTAPSVFSNPLPPSAVAATVAVGSSSAPIGTRPSSSGFSFGSGAGFGASSGFSGSSPSASAASRPTYSLPPTLTGFPLRPASPSARAATLRPPRRAVPTPCTPAPTPAFSSRCAVR